MANLQYAKESILIKVISDVAENDKRTQSLELCGSTVWKGKSVAMTMSLSDALWNNTRLTALNLSECNIGDGALCKLADAIQHNATLFDLNLSHNKLGRPGLIHLAKCLTDNTGLMTLDLIGHRINSEVRQPRNGCTTRLLNGPSGRVADCPLAGPPVRRWPRRLWRCLPRT